MTYQMPMVWHQGDPTINRPKENPIIFTTDGQPKILSHFGARTVIVREQSQSEFYGDLVFFCFGFGLDDSLKAEGQRLLMPHLSHLGLSGVQIVCPNPTYKTFFQFFSAQTSSSEIKAGFRQHRTITTILQSNNQRKALLKY